MNDQCHDCKIRKLCYLEEPEEDWTCNHYEPCEYDEEDVPDINVGGKDTISRKAAIEALKNDMASLDHIIKGMSANDVRLDAYVSQRNQVNYDIYTINNLPPALGTNLAEVGTDCISRQQATDTLRGYLVGKRCPDDGTLTCRLIENEVINKLPPAQPKGHWIEIALSNHTYKCSVCGRLLVNITDGKNNVAKNYPYCHCGADMRGEQYERDS